MNEHLEKYEMMKSKERLRGENSPKVNHAQSVLINEQLHNGILESMEIDGEIQCAD